MQDISSNKSFIQTLNYNHINLNDTGLLLNTDDNFNS